MQNKKGKGVSGFTLVELLLVIGIIATLAVVVFVALDPAKRFQDAQDARRISDMQSILSAVHQYIIDNKGTFPTDLVYNNEMQMGTASAGCAISTGYCAVEGDSECVNLGPDLAKYLKSIPFDPVNGNESLTGYTIIRGENNIITVRSCSANDSSIESVSR